MPESGRLDPDLAQQAIEYCYQQDSAAMKGEGEVGGGFSPGARAGPGRAAGRVALLTDPR